MKNEINMGIGFVTGRANVCEIINSYYKEILDQVKKYEKKVNVTFFILYDTEYLNTDVNDFYNINLEVYDSRVKIKYITPDNIREERHLIRQRYDLSEEEADLIFGHGHARGRNTLMYYALKSGIDYLLFWDDDEYPRACLKAEDGTVYWKKQDNVLKHIEYMEKENADITIAYHCGYISPIPYMECDEDEKGYVTRFIEAIGNEFVTWESIKEKFEKDGGITFAKEDIANGEGAYEQPAINGRKYLAGSTLCLNLTHLEKIPAFYNPPGARGEDTFFSIALDKDAKVIKIPLYHFHDGFLKYKEIMQGEEPKKLRVIKSSEKNIEKRFLKASQGWIKYKPLFMYITDTENYDENIKNVYNNLNKSIEEINNLFDNSNFLVLQDNLKEYDENVKKHYSDFIETNRIWKTIKEHEKKWKK